MWLAGGGAKGGTVVGATDEFGLNATENPISVNDFHATILHLLGLDHEKLTFKHSGRDERLTDVAGEVVRAAIRGRWLEWDSNLLLSVTSLPECQVGHTSWQPGSLAV